MSYASTVTVAGPRILPSDTIFGSSVRSADGEHLGVIQHLLLDTTSGSIVFAVISFGGILGLGGKLSPVPWKALSRGAEEKDFVLNVTKETLASAPSFDRNHWPKPEEIEWFERVFHFYGLEPGWTGSR
ncbi:PRC-barrel domain-containing protein [Methanofollis fontis]|nr:PRC-barrel domain-containing protein [Methanofollis fontis]